MSIAKITKKGQITLPAQFRKQLKTNVVSIEMVDNTIIISPAMNPGGVFNAYALKEKSADEIMSLEKEAYNDAIIKKYNNSGC